MVIGDVAKCRLEPLTHVSLERQVTEADLIRARAVGLQHLRQLHLRDRLAAVRHLCPRSVSHGLKLVHKLFGPNAVAVLQRVANVAQQLNAQARLISSA